LPLLTAVAIVSTFFMAFLLGLCQAAKDADESVENFSDATVQRRRHGAEILIERSQIIVVDRRAEQRCDERRAARDLYPDAHRYMDRVPRVAFYDQEQL
jgi:hypothetical protein